MKRRVISLVLALLLLAGLPALSASAEGAWEFVGFTWSRTHTGVVEKTIGLNGTDHPMRFDFSEEADYLEQITANLEEAADIAFTDLDAQLMEQLNSRNFVNACYAQIADPTGDKTGRATPANLEERVADMIVWAKQTFRLKNDLKFKLETEFDDIPDAVREYLYAAMCDRINAKCSFESPDPAANYVEALRETEEHYNPTLAFATFKSGSETRTVEAAVTAVLTRPTCETDGAWAYTAAVTAEESPDGAAHSEDRTEVLPALGHVSDEWTQTKAPTCTEAGEETCYCARCGRTATRAIAALGHDYETVVTEPTCTEAGFTTFTCKRCGETHTGDPVAAPGHTSGPLVYENQQAETCTEDGSFDAVHYCTVCGAELSRVTEKTPATGHNWGEWKLSKQPTPEAEGEETRTCAYCGGKEKRTVDKLEPQSNPIQSVTDVQPTSYYSTPVIWAMLHNITKGTSDTTFSPDAPCTRGMIVTFLWRAVGEPEPESTNCPFEDVGPNDYYYKAVLWAVEHGVTNGLDATHFGPSVVCTRGQVVTFLWRANGKPEPSTTECPFTDVAATAYYYKAVLCAVEFKVTTGTTATTFSPDANCTRGQIVTFLYRNMVETEA